MEKRIELDDRFGSQYKGEYLFVSISYGRSNAITAECTKVHPLGQRTEIDVKTLNAKMVLATLIKKPKIITLEHMVDESSNGLPTALGELLMAATDYVNGYSPKERDRTKKLKEQWGLE